MMRIKQDCCLSLNNVYRLNQMSVDYSNDTDADIRGFWNGAQLSKENETNRLLASKHARLI